MRSRLQRLALVLPIAVSLAACTATPKDGALTSDEPSLPTTIAPQPSASQLQTRSAPDAVAAKGSEFAVTPPKDWSNDTGKQPKALLFLKAPKPVELVFPTFSVIETSIPKPQPLDSLVEQGMIGQRQQGAEVSTVADRRIGGAPASGYRMTRTAKNDNGEQKVTQTQYYLVRGTKVFITTMTASDKDKSATKTLDEILGSWSWGPITSPTPSASGTPSPSATD